jgi:hypothetical protein
VTVNVDRWGLNIVAKKDPFPNEWEEVFNIDESDILSPPFIDVLEDSVIWHLPDPYCCVVRAYNRSEHKVREFAYKRESIARAKIKELAENGDELTILTQAMVATINYSDDGLT